jgi:hypothetical protein
MVGDLVLDAEPVLQAQRLDVQVVAHHLELPGQRHRLLLPRTQRVAQRVGEARHGDLRGLRVVGDERAHGVQGIEEEVRVHLRLQQPQLGLLQGTDQLRVPQLRLLAVPHRDNREVQYLPDREQRAPVHPLMEKVQDRRLTDGQ